MLYSAQDHTRVLILHKCGGAVTGLKCFLVVFVWSVHFVDSKHIGIQPSECPYSTSLVIKQTDSIILATSGDLKCYACDQQC